MPTITSKLNVLIAERELLQKRRLSIRTIAAESGASFSAVQRLKNNTIKEVPLDDLARICTYFGVGIEAILVLDTEATPPTQPALPVVDADASAASRLAKAEDKLT